MGKNQSEDNDLQRLSPRDPNEPSPTYAPDAFDFIKQLPKNKSGGGKNANVKTVAIPRPRIARCPAPCSQISFDEWVETVLVNFPDLLHPTETALSVVAQLLILDVKNPFALVFVDVPSSGKTISLNFFATISELIYASDKFTPASFLSNAANVKKEKLAEIDLLPRLQYKGFIIRDLATLFSKRDDDLNELLGILTRVLDGEGLNTDSGVHGQRDCSGEYLFMVLAASTPIQPRVWKMMGSLGSRLFFLSINSREKSEDELVAQLSGTSYKQKEQACQYATKDFLYGLWNRYPDGIEWNRANDDKDVLTMITRCAKLLASLRGIINIRHDDFNGPDRDKYDTPIIERPDRINQLFYNLARGHALVSGRTQINRDDMRVIFPIMFDSCPVAHSSMIKKLLERGGSMTTSEAERELNCSKPTARNEMRKLEILRICTSVERTGHDECEITLADEFRWFLSDECRGSSGVSGSIKQI